MLELLLIEDDLIDQLTLTRLIKKNNLNCKVSLSDSIQEASEILQSNHFDLVVCDLNLPDGNAFDLKDFMGRQPFVLLSGYIEPQITQKAMNHGAIQVLQKSSELSQLRSILDLIKNMLGGSNESQTDIKANPSLNALPFNIPRMLETFDQNVPEIIDILKLFLIEHPKSIDHLKVQIAEKNRSKIKKKAHRLKSNYNLIGLQEAFNLAEKIEEEVLNTAFEQIEFQILQLEKAVEQDVPTLMEAVRTLEQNQKNAT